jgi:hypothetical protein
MHAGRSISDCTDRVRKLESSIVPHALDQQVGVAAVLDRRRRRRFETACESLLEGSRIRCKAGPFESLATPAARLATGGRPFFPTF